MVRSHDTPSPAKLGITVHPFAACSLQLFLRPAEAPTLVLICIPRIGAFALSATCPHRYYFSKHGADFGCLGRVASILCRALSPIMTEEKAERFTFRRKALRRTAHLSGPCWCWVLRFI